MLLYLSTISPFFLRLALIEALTDRMAEFTGEKKSNEKDCSTIMQGTEGDKAADFANYFCSYSYLHHQKQMVSH